MMHTFMSWLCRSSLRGLVAFQATLPEAISGIEIASPPPPKAGPPLAEEASTDPPRGFAALPHSQTCAALEDVSAEARVAGTLPRNDAGSCSK